MIHRIRLLLKTVSEVNARCHWATRAKRVCLARDLARLSVEAEFVRGDFPSPPLTVTLIRVAPRKLDSDNLLSALKAIRDGVADALLPANRGNQVRRWSDDGDGRIKWRCGQAKGKPRQNEVIIIIRKEGK